MGAVKYLQYIASCSPYFFFQIGVGMEPAGGIDDDLPGVLCLCRRNGVVDDRRRIGAFTLRDHRGTDAFGPDLKLFNGRCPECGNTYNLGQYVHPTQPDEFPLDIDAHEAEHCAD